MSRRSAGSCPAAWLCLLASAPLWLSSCTALRSGDERLSGRPVSSCGGVLVDTQNDAQNCGECGNHCSAAGPECDAPVVCRDGGCVCVGVSTVPTCGAGHADCGAGCVDLATTKESCGECGNACVDNPSCSAPTVCIDGGCVCPGALSGCLAGEVSCDGVCVDPLTDDANCGGCGEICGDGELFCDGNGGCVEGACAQVEPPCGDQGCDELTDTCGSCDDAQFPCPTDESFCDAYFACEGSVCVEHPRRCEDPALPFCDANTSTCTQCTDDAGCDAENDGLLCNGITYCAGGVCVENPDPCGELLCSEGAGCHECDVDADCSAGHCETSGRTCVSP